MNKARSGGKNFPGGRKSIYKGFEKFSLTSKFEKVRG